MEPSVAIMVGIVTPDDCTTLKNQKFHKIALRKKHFVQKKALHKKHIAQEALCTKITY